MRRRSLVILLHWSVAMLVLMMIKGGSAAPALRYDEKDELQARWIRAATGQAVAPGSHGLPSSQGFVTACLLGLGWGMNPAPLVADQLAEGTLVELVPGVTLDVPLYWQNTRLLRDVLDPLGRAVRRAARQGLAIPD